MYLCVTRGRFDPAAVERLPGFQQLYQARDLSGGTTVTISLWDTEAHARFSRDQMGDVIARIADAGVRLEPPEILEIV